MAERKDAEAKLLRQYIEQQVLLDLIPAVVLYKNDKNELFAQTAWPGWFGSVPPLLVNRRTFGTHRSQRDTLT